jgi:hypothetical protein
MILYFFMVRMLPNDDMGYPKLFMGCQHASGMLVPHVVNDVAANRAATVSDWPSVSLGYQGCFSFALLSCRAVCLPVQDVFYALREEHFPVRPPDVPIT